MRTIEDEARILARYNSKIRKRKESPISQELWDTAKSPRKKETKKALLRLYQRMKWYNLKEDLGKEYLASLHRSCTMRIAA